MDSEMKEALNSLGTAFPRIRFHYHDVLDCIFADSPKGEILVDRTQPMKWEAILDEESILAETPVRAVRLLSQRTGLDLGGI